jgi:hypothetical protein
VSLPGQQRPLERLRATPRRLADKPAASTGQRTVDFDEVGLPVVRLALRAATLQERYDRQAHRSARCYVFGCSVGNPRGGVGLVGAVGVAGNVIGTNRAASFAASRAAVSARSMKISASMAYSIHIAVTRQTSAYH